jgi:hypothetical protein
LPAEGGIGIELYNAVQLELYPRLPRSPGRLLMVAATRRIGHGIRRRLDAASNKVSSITLNLSVSTSYFLAERQHPDI